MATIDRVALTAWLTAWRGTVAAAAGRAVTDTADGWAPALDEVVATGTAHPALPDRWVEPITDYWALRLLANTLDTRFDLTTSAGAQYRLAQVADRVRGQLEHAEALIRPWLSTSGAFAAVPYAGGLTRDDVAAHLNDPDAEPPLFTRRTGPPLVGLTDTRWTRRWP